MMDNYSNLEIPYHNNGEFLPRLYLYINKYLVQRLENLISCIQLESQYTNDLLNWLRSQIPDGFESIEELYDEILKKSEMSSAAGFSVGIPSILYTMAYLEQNDINNEDDFYRQLEFDYIKEKAYHTVGLVLSLIFVSHLSDKYCDVISILCEKEHFDNVTLHDFIQLCSDDTCNRLKKFEGEKQVYSLLSIFLPECITSANPLLTHPICDDRLYSLFSGENGFVPRFMELIEYEEPIPKMLLREDTHSSILDMIEQDRKLFLFYGEPMSGKTLMAKTIAKDVKKQLVICDIGDLLKYAVNPGENGESEKTYVPEYPEIEKRLDYVLREACTVNSIILIDGLVEGCDDAVYQICSFMYQLVGSYCSCVIINYDSEKEASTPAYVTNYNFKRLDPAERVELWQHFTQDLPDIDEDDLKETAMTFDLTPGQIENAAGKLAVMNEKITKKILHKLCYRILNNQLSSQAKLVESDFTWNDIKLDKKNKGIMHDICNAVENKPFIMNDWNFKSKLPYGSGITVLFAGPPGTGKTMGASVIANELGMELYKIDLSRLIDKYVGETEKNIRRIFNLAARSNCILFFDEADAIFNKRMDAKDANERFANIESSLLLQCIEEYEGVAILATNKMSAMDPAFMRRFRFYLQFSEPDEDTALEIWNTVFPAELPLDEDVDFKELAHIFKFTGAIIKNVALQASFLAASERTSVNALHILKAARREMEKNQRVITREELGEYAYLYDDMMAIS